MVGAACAGWEVREYTRGEVLGVISSAAEHMLMLTHGTCLPIMHMRMKRSQAQFSMYMHMSSPACVTYVKQGR